ncbi:ABC transporter permease [Zwartia vadi]|uniref:ABC transporter permease n=1 Tax=Zwartia vadi TaxID=3058168 RepID=UPI0025B54E25|nr:ABC transporter permease [Zwartia vadi]MDN3988221.1 ABC transporter permease [Zwartia vadi]
MRILFSIWAYRSFIFGSVKREFQSRYRNSLLGAAWTVINPLAMIIVYTLIFTQIMRAKLPGIESQYAYSIYLCTGVLTWGYFAEIVTRAQNVFIENANLIKKINFPRLCLPVVIVANATLNFLIIFGLFTIFLIISGSFPGFIYLSLIPLLIIQVAFSIGLGITLGVLNVFFRDVGQFFSVVIQFWFWLTPIVYPAAILPESVRAYLAYNPMVNLMVAYQDIVVYGRGPNWSSLWPLTLLAVFFCVWGFLLFKKRSGEMVDEL